MITSHTNFKIQNAFAIAMVVSVLLILQQYTSHVINDYDYDFSWFSVSARIAINYLLWAGVFNLFARIANSFQSRKITVSFIGFHAILATLVSLVHRVIAILVFDFIYYFKSGYLREFLTPGNQTQLGAGIFSSFLQYAVIVVIVLALTYYSQFVNKQKELESARLNALQMQLQPHFLFNTLNSITSLIDIDGKKAQKMLSQLGFLLREILEHDNKHFITLANEIKFIKTYLEIEHTRFADRLLLKFDVSPELNSIKVPSLILQPIVENAIKHGISKCVDGGLVELIATEQKHSNGHVLEIKVLNDISTVNGNSKEGYGIGTSNVKNRLEQYYGVDYSYENTIVQNKFISKITFPIERIEND